MQISDLLEDFGTPESEKIIGLSDEELETLRLESFEEGYKAGWDDAAQAQANDQRNLASVFAQNLLDLSFTYNEAYSHLIKGLKPLLMDVTNKVLPEIMQATIGQRIAEELTKTVNSIKGASEVVIHVPPDSHQAVEDLLAQDFSFPVSVRADASLLPGQAQLSFEDGELEINLDELIIEIQSAIESFTYDVAQGGRDERKKAI